MVDRLLQCGRATKKEELVVMIKLTIFPRIARRSCSSTKAVYCLQVNNCNRDTAYIFTLSSNSDH
jgi:hypothetical protein